MVLVPTGVFDVVPRSCLMTFETLINAGVGFPCNRGGDHFEVHHVMTGRSLMALGAVTGVTGRMSEIGNRPAIGCMAGRTIGAKQFEMPIVVGMTGSTVEQVFGRGDVCVRDD